MYNHITQSKSWNRLVLPILPILIGCCIFMFSMYVHVCFPVFCVVLYIISDVIDLN